MSLWQLRRNSRFNCAAHRGGDLLYIDFHGLMQIGIPKNCIIHVMVNRLTSLHPGMFLVAALLQRLFEASDSDVGSVANF